MSTNEETHYEIKRGSIAWNVVIGDLIVIRELDLSDARKSRDCLNNGESPYAWVRRESIPFTE